MKTATKAGVKANERGVAALDKLKRAYQDAEDAHGSLEGIVEQQAERIAALESDLAAEKAEHAAVLTSVRESYANEIATLKTKHAEAADRLNKVSGIILA